MPSRIKLVVFDWAGTVIDFGSCAPAAAFVQVFARRGVTVSLAQARAPMGMHKRDHLLAMLNDPHISAAWRQAHQRDWTEADVDALYAAVMPLQLAGVDQHDALIPEFLGCAEALRRRGILLGGTTGYFRDAAQRCLDAARRQGYVPDANVCADDVRAGRPAPWMLFRTMEALNVYPPGAVIKVGDTLVDVEAGHNAGVWSVAVTSSSSEMGLTRSDYQSLSAEQRQRRLGEVSARLATARPHAVLETLAELPAVVQRIEARLAQGERP